MKQFTFICSFLFLCTLQISAQNNFNIDTSGIHLQKLALSIQSDSVVSKRLIADSHFTKALVQTLKTPFSFNFNFDSLTAIKHLKSPDGRFKLFTWQLDLGDGTYRQRGAMQLPTLDGKLNLLPFFDNSDFVQNTSLGVFDRHKWMGAIYYEIIPIQSGNEIIYTLLGFDENTISISKKIIEVMRFENGQPLFGGDYFKFTPDPTYPIGIVDRFIYAFKKGSNAIIKYDKSTRSIMISELASTNHDLKNPETLVPSGQFNNFTWLNNQWVLTAIKGN